MSVDNTNTPTGTHSPEIQCLGVENSMKLVSFNSRAKKGDIVLMVEMENICWTDVPSYLKCGAFYECLDRTDNSTFSIPSACFKRNPNVDSERDLSLILNSIRFWATQELPIDAIQYVLEHSAVSDLEDLFVEFVELQTLLQNILKVKSASLTNGIVIAIEVGLGVPVVDLLREKGYDLSTEACETAAATGDLEVLMYLHTEGCPWNKRTTTAAAANSQLACLAYALDLSCPVDKELVNQTAKLGLIEVLKTLRSHGFGWNERTALHAISNNHVECLKFLQSAGCEVTPVAFCTAAKYGAIECIEYLLSLGFEWHPQTCDYAAQYGQLTALAFCHTHGAEWGTLTSYAAASYGHLECLVYLHKHDCPWNERALKGAIAGGYWPCVRYCYTNNCPCLHTLLIVVSFGLVLLYTTKAHFLPYRFRFHDVAMLAVFIRTSLWMFWAEYQKPLQRDSQGAWYWKVLYVVFALLNVVFVYIMWLWVPMIYDVLRYWVLPNFWGYLDI